jgi:hypothetical protein
MIVRSLLVRVQSILERWPLHTAVIAIDLVLFYASITAVEAPIILLAMALLLLFAGLLAALLVAVTGGFARAAIGVTVILLLTFLVPVIVGAPETIGQAGRITVLVAAALAAVLVSLCLRGAKRDVRFLTLMFNVVVIGYSIVPVKNALQVGFDLHSRRPSAAELYPDVPAVSAVAAADTPDVWHFVLDRYAGPETMRRIYGFDDEPFFAELERRGFAVGRGAAANYQRTAPSLASTLNLDYLTPLQAPTIAGYDELPLYRALHGNRVSRFFAALGYDVIHAGPWWEPTRHGDSETENLNYRDMPELIGTMIQRSLMGYLAISTGIEFGNGRLDQCRRIHYQLDRLGALARSAGRKFVFAHILLPHPPFVVDADGRCKTAAEAKRLSRVENYVAQVKYANQRILDLIDRIEAGRRPAVIILQSDEGPWPAAYAGNELTRGADVTLRLDWTTLGADLIREKMLILYAIRVPQGAPVPLDPHPTPVNTYRRILNRFFGTDYALLPERSYVFQDARHLYSFTDVTAKLH